MFGAIPVELKVSLHWRITNVASLQNLQLCTVTWEFTNLRPFSFITPKTLNYLAFQSFNFDVPDEGYFRNASCTLNLISTFLLQNY